MASQSPCCKKFVPDFGLNFGSIGFSGCNSGTNILSVLFCKIWLCMDLKHPLSLTVLYHGIFFFHLKLGIYFCDVPEFPWSIKWLKNLVFPCNNVSDNIMETSFWRNLVLCPSSPCIKTYIIIITTLHYSRTFYTCAKILVFPKFMGEN